MQSGHVGSLMRRCPTSQNIAERSCLRSRAVLNICAQFEESSPRSPVSCAFSSYSSACTLCCDAFDTIVFCIPLLIQCSPRFRISLVPFSLHCCRQLPLAPREMLLEEAAGSFTCFVIPTATRGRALKASTRMNGSPFCAK